MKTSTSSKPALRPPGFRLEPSHDLKGLRRRRERDGSPALTTELPLVGLVGIFAVFVFFLLAGTAVRSDQVVLHAGLMLPPGRSGAPLHRGPLLTLRGTELVLETGASGMPPVSRLPQDQDFDSLVSALRALRLLSTQNRADLEMLHLQADEATPLADIKRLLLASAGAGWPRVNFVVRTGEETDPSR